MYLVIGPWTAKFCLSLNQQMTMRKGGQTALWFLVVFIIITTTATTTTTTTATATSSYHSSLGSDSAFSFCCHWIAAIGLSPPHLPSCPPEIKAHQGSTGFCSLWSSTDNRIPLQVLPFTLLWHRSIKKGEIWQLKTKAPAVSVI